MWLGDDWIFYRADGFRPMRISNHSIERMVADLDLLNEPRRAPLNDDFAEGSSRSFGLFSHVVAPRPP